MASKANHYAKGNGHRQAKQGINMKGVGKEVVERNKEYNKDDLYGRLFDDQHFFF